jgi:hypothetical protein
LVDKAGGTVNGVNAVNIAQRSNGIHRRMAANT